MQGHVTLKLYATLQPFLPPGGEEIPIAIGMTVQDLLRRIGVPEEKAQLIFIDGVKGELSTSLQGGERSVSFPRSEADEDLPDRCPVLGAAETARRILS